MLKSVFGEQMVEDFRHASGMKGLDFILKATGSHQVHCERSHLARLIWQQCVRQTQGAYLKDVLVSRYTF
jgi:hypothetical protein